MHENFLWKGKKFHITMTKMQASKADKENLALPRWKIHDLPILFKYSTLS